MLLGTEGSFGKSAQPSNEEQLRKLILQEIKNPNKASASLKVENLINDNWALCTKESILLNHTKLIKQSSLKGFVNGEEISRLSPLDFAVESNNVQIASLLLMLCVQKKWIIPGHSGGLLHIATRYNSVDMIKLLTSQFKTPESARVLVNFGLDELDEDGLTCLMIAAWNGFEEIVSHLLSRGADWKLEDKNKHNSLFRAALHFQKEVLYTMAQQKVDLNCRNSNGTTPLIELVKRGEEDQIIYYISLGAQVNFTDANQRTPLHHASFGDLTIFSLLVQNNAIIDALDDQGRSPVFYAVMSRNDFVVGYLFSRNLNWKIVDHNGKTMSDYGVGSTKELIEELIADRSS